MLTIDVAQLTEDIKEVMEKHEVSKEFYALQLTRILLDMLSGSKKRNYMPDDVESVPERAKEQPKQRVFDMRSIVDDILKSLERNAIPIAALDWVFQNVKEETERRSIVSHKLPFQVF